MTRIQVKTIPANFFVEVPENATAADIRAEVAKHITIHPARQSNPVDDSETLSDLSLLEVSRPKVYVSFGAAGQTTDPSPSSDGRFQIRIVSSDGIDIHCRVTKNTKIERIYQAIQDANGIPVDQQRLTFAGEFLQPASRLASYNNIENGSIIQLRY